MKKIIIEYKDGTKETLNMTGYEFIEKSFIMREVTPSKNVSKVIPLSIVKSLTEVLYSPLHFEEPIDKCV